MSELWVFLDVESRGPIDLIKHGAYNYWAHEETEAYLLCYAFSNATTKVKTWTLGEPCPQDLHAHITAGKPISTHNAEFEYLALVHHFAGRLGWPRVTLDQMVCTATLARAHGLPGGLEKAARCMELPTNKDMGGHLLMLKVCKPKGVDENGDWIYEELTPEVMEKLQAYCEKDVLTTIALTGSLVQFTPELNDLYHASMRINERGVRIDTAFAEAAATAAETIKDVSHFKVSAFTAGDLHSSTQTVALKAWINKESGLALPNVAVRTLESIQQEDVPPHVWQVIQARLEGRAAAASKYKAALNGADPDDGRFRGAYLTNGAATTGRFSSARLQVHNMRRDTPKSRQLHNLRNTVVANQFKGSLDLLSSCIRGVILPAPGNVLVKADWAQIEARVAPWLFSEESESAQRLLDVFRRGEDVYEVQATAMYNTDEVTSELRFRGKVAQLALAYQGGWRALDSMAISLGVEPFGEAKGKHIVQLWRTANPWASHAWVKLQLAALNAMTKPNTLFSAGRIKYFKMTEKPFLIAVLPSGRRLYYPFPKLEMNERGDPQITYKKATTTPKKGETEWPRTALYGGLQLENVTQAVAADSLRESLIMLDSIDLPVVIHTHDDIVLEVPKRQAKQAAALLESVMERCSIWAEGLPLKADAVILERFR